jgi:hypothetical protein
VKNRLEQTLLFQMQLLCRYALVVIQEADELPDALPDADAVGLCTLNQVDP